MKLGNVERLLRTMRRIGLMTLFTVLPLFKRGIMAVHNPPAEVFISGSLLMAGACAFFTLWSVAATAVYYGEAAQTALPTRVPLPAYGLTLAAPTGLGAWMYASHATGNPLLAIETGLLGASLVLMAAIALHEGQQLRAWHAAGGLKPGWWRFQR